MAALARNFVLLGALASGLSMTAAGLASAAPDNTLGMALLSAAVSSDGTLLRGSGATAATRTNLGRFTVTFDRDLTECHVLASISGHGSFVTPNPTIQATSAALADPQAVFVAITNDAGTSFDRGFHLLVFCPR